MTSPSPGPSASDLPAARYPLPATSPPLDAFLAELLGDQQTLQTPVTRAATAHSRQPSAWRAERFRELIPLTAPAPGQHYAFEVDLDSCSGCKACVSGCHSLNGLDEGETWRDVGLVLAESSGSGEGAGTAILSQTVTSACHHCADPACLNGCPVLAYEKDPVTGVVRHLDDQCIGCSYCVLKCPYDAPKYNKRLGIVRKCDMCHGRLSAGEAPACAQACPTQAIKIVLVPVATNASTPATAPSGDASASPYDTVVSLPADPTYTRPGTRYVSARALPGSLRAADAAVRRPQPGHLALVILLVGTQLALGLLAAGLLLPAAGFFFAALGASVAHLGQPLRAWRVFLGLRRSWLSREAVLFGAAAPLLSLAAAVPLVAWLPLPASIRGPLVDWTAPIEPFTPVLSSAALLLLAGGVVCSAMIYIDTRRRFWRPANTALRMVGTVVVSWLAFPLPLAAALMLVAKLLAEHRLLLSCPVSAQLHAEALRISARARVGFGVSASGLWVAGQVVPGFVVFALGELLERVLYFRAVDAPKMPGQPAA